LLTHHRREEFEIYCYAAVPRPDEITARLRGAADRWRDIAALDDAKTAQIVRDDGIDILVDLTLHCAQNRLLLFARRPAPVQVSYLGYPGSSGLKTMDYRLSDPYLDPLDERDPGYSEKTIRLPRTYWCYEPLAAPHVGPLPANVNGHVTFGCLNNF